jgi:phosphopantothenoylcysteine decarboxylase/phosphopantothenate--cysteine ligase
VTSQSKPLTIVLGVGGGIAAYKVATLLRLFKEQGHDVYVVPTPAALKFVGDPTWEALSGHPVVAEVWDNVSQVNHVKLGQEADLVVVAPATADLISRAASGAANDLLTNVLLTATCPVVFAPAMHTEMWLNNATQSNVATLRNRGNIVLEPAVGRLTGSDSGPGRLLEPEDIAQAALASVNRGGDFAGKHVVITAGGTREYIDPVRYIGNKSSGLQGIALAQAAQQRGAQVTLIAANVSQPLPLGITNIKVETTAELHNAVKAAGGDVVIMAAAVADFKPKHIADHKIKKDDAGSVPEIELERTADILADLVTNRQSGQIIVGFAAETGDDQTSVLDYGRAKLARKGCDLLVVNDVSGDKAFGSADNEVMLITKATEIHVPRASKRIIADAVLDQIASMSV